MQEGPVLTDQDGNLSVPISMCAWREHRCKFFGVHDWHYFYCAAQDAQNKHPHVSHGDAYPWAGAGKQLRSNEPDSGCPFVGSNKKSAPEAESNTKEVG